MEDAQLKFGFSGRIRRICPLRRREEQSLMNHRRSAMTGVDHLPRLSPGAQRMRRYRRRREARQQCITLTLHEYQVWGLVAFGFLDKDHRQNREAVADALRAYLNYAMPPIE